MTAQCKNPFSVLIEGSCFDVDYASITLALARMNIQNLTFCTDSVTKKNRGVMGNALIIQIRDRSPAGIPNTHTHNETQNIGADYEDFPVLC